MLLLQRPSVQKKGWGQPTKVRPPLLSTPLHQKGVGWPAPTSASHPRYRVRTTALTSTAVPFTAAAPGVSFFKLLVAFVAGGLFFSTAIAAVTACYAVGMENVHRLLTIFRIVLRDVWTTFTQGLGAAKTALRTGGGFSWKWKDAWRVLKENLAETRKMAAQGVQAIRKQGNLYAAAVGVPGLIPLQYIIDRLLPFSIASQLQDGLKEALAGMENKNHLRDLKLTGFSIGTKSPKLEAARVYDLGSDAMAFDCDVVWNSELEADIKVYLAGGLARLPVSVKNVRFDGVIRVVLTPLVKKAPGYGAALISFPSVPSIGLDVRVAGGEVTRVPWLRSELMSAIQKGIADDFLWPRRLVVPTTVEGSKKPLLTKQELDKLQKSDPLLLAENALAEEPMLRENLEKSKPDPRSLRKLMTVLLKDDTEDDKNDSFAKTASANGDTAATAATSKTQEHSLSKLQQPSPTRRSSVQTGILWESIDKFVHPAKG